MSVVIETTIGAFTVDLYTEVRPKVCRNFLKLCKVKYYNFCLFHNVQAGFLAQSGDPTGTGRGGESIHERLYGEQARYFEGEMLPKIKHEKKGHLSMVGVGNAMFGSQFFITLDEKLDYLDGDHCVFGEVVEGYEVLDRFNEVISDESHRPFQDIRITHTVILEDPYEDPERLEIPPSPIPDPEMLKSDRLGAEEDIDSDSELDEEQKNEIAAAKEAKAQATILEMIGDLPDADCAPPENVLFVCKLNPVTTDEDLEIIFSRFGKVVSCEVIKDHKTGDSLQYAFVEFDSPKVCELAYFKMDNVLIDDRRIHVDFSQSVSKYEWKGKGRLKVHEDGKRDERRNAPENHRKELRKPERRSRSKSRDRRKRSRSRERSNRSREYGVDRQRRRERSSSANRKRNRRSSSRDKKRRSRSRSRERHRRNDHTRNDKSRRRH